MNQQQAKYTIERINTVERNKIADLKKECTVPAKTISAEEKAELLRKGKVKLRSDVTVINGYTDVVDVFDFSKYCWPERLSDDYEDHLQTIKAAAHKVRDEVMLGDNAEALRLLREFAGE